MKSENIRRAMMPLPFISLLIWLMGIALSRDNEIGELGLATSMHWLVYLGFFLLLISTFYFILTPGAGNNAFMVLCLLLLVLYIYASPLLIEGTVRTAHSWQKYGFTDYIIRNGALSDGLLYHNFPLFFIFSAGFQFVTGLGPSAIMAIIPFIMEIAILVFILAITRSLFNGNIKMMGLGAVTLFMVMWVNQFNYLPQVMGLAFFMLGIHLILNHLEIKDWKFWLLMSLLMITTLYTHPLSAMVLTLYFGLHLAYKFIPMEKKELTVKVKGLVKNTRMMGLMAAGAFALIAMWAIFSSKIAPSTSSTLDITVIATTLGVYWDRFATTTAAHRILMLVRILFSLAVVLMAIYAARKLKNDNIYYYLMIGASIVPVFLFYYGAELVERAYLFSTLPLVLLALRGVDKKRFLTFLIVFIMLAVPIHMLAHYGNEQIDMVPPSQIEAANFIFQHAPNGTIYGGTVCESSQYVEVFKTRFMERMLDTETNETEYAVMTSTWENSVLWFRNDVELWNDINEHLATPQYDIIYSTRDTVLFKDNT